MFLLDFQDRRPVYEQIVDKIQTLILYGALKPMVQLPSVRNLAVELSINPNTIQKAYHVLEQEGYIVPIKGVGNFVTDDEALLQLKKDLYKQELKKVVLYARERGISRDEFIEAADSYYGEVRL